MEETRFSDIGKVEAIARMFEGTGYRPDGRPVSDLSGKGGALATAGRLFLEGIDFDLVYFPLKHLGYKCVLAVAGELLASLAHPVRLTVCLGVSAKLDFAQVREIFGGVAAAAREAGFVSLDLDLVPSKNGLAISIHAAGEVALLTAKRRPAPKSKDLICVSGSLGAAYMGLQLLERGKADFAQAEKDIAQYKMLVAAYLKPEMDWKVVSALEEAEIYPSAGYLVGHGLADAVKRLCRDTGLGAKIYADKIPFEGNTFALGKEMDVDPVSAAMNGGEDYRLLFTVPILALEKFRRDFQVFDIIGHLAQPEAGAVLVTPEGVELPLRAQGWPREDEQELTDN